MAFSNLPFIVLLIVSFQDSITDMYLIVREYCHQSKKRWQAIVI
jgi:hypothetical protein